MTTVESQRKEAYYRWMNLTPLEIKPVVLRLTEFPEYDNGQCVPGKGQGDDFEVLFLIRGKNHPPDKSPQLQVHKALGGNWTIVCDQQIFEVIQDVIRPADDVVEPKSQSA